jgi:hypothetical protein
MTPDDDHDDNADPFEPEVAPLGDGSPAHVPAARVCGYRGKYVRAATRRPARADHPRQDGTLRRIVHSVLEKHPAVKSFQSPAAAVAGRDARRLDVAGDKQRLSRRSRCRDDERQAEVSGAAGCDLVDGWPTR